MTAETTTTLEQAARTFIARRDRTAHPTGKFDNARRWYPSEAETCGVKESDLRKEVRRLDPPAKPTREGGDRYYKAVQRTADGRLVSIHDGSTEYRLGEEMQEAARQNHGGGFYAYATQREAETFARNAGVDNAVILRVEGSGQYCRYQSKLAFSRMVPLEIVSE